MRVGKPRSSGVVDPDSDAFIRSAEELNARLASNALLGADKFLHRQHWEKTCDTTGEFYVEYHLQAERSLKRLLVDSEAELPAMLHFLRTAELEKLFPAIDAGALTVGPIAVTIDYLMAKVVADLLAGFDPPSDLNVRAERTFAALWALPGTTGNTELWMSFRAHEALLALTTGSHRGVVATYDREYGFDLGKYESAARTLVKQCYMLSRIATGTADEDMVFGARSYCALLKFHHYLWLMNDDENSKIGLVPVALVSWLYERITKGSAPSTRELFASMAPRAVLAEVEALRRA